MKSSLLVTLYLLICILNITHAAECPSYWTRFRSHCYRFFGTRRTWLKAEARCNEFSSNAHSNDEVISHLASISSQAENDFVYNLWASVRETEGNDALVWLGFYKPLGRNYFTWADDSAVDYTNWDVHRPNDIGGVEDCVEMWEAEVTDTHRPRSWNDRSCKSEASYICKMQYE